METPFPLLDAKGAEVFFSGFFNGSFGISSNSRRNLLMHNYFVGTGALKSLNSAEPLKNLEK
jgi:hypothetical protein